MDRMTSARAFLRLMPAGVSLSLGVLVATAVSGQTLRLEEATIGEIQHAINAKEVTTVEVVRRYLERIKAYNGVCVQQPDGLLGAITPISGAGQINALQTLNLRPAARKAMGFDDRKARSMTDLVDAAPAMPDALEVAAELDRRFAATGRLVGPLHGVVFAIKDQYDTFDMRTTNGADAPFANDRPPADATVVTRLRAAGAIILAKANMGEYASGDRSSFGGTFCNPYDTTRGPGGSSGGSGSSVAANLVTCAIGEESGPSIRFPARANSVVGIAPSQGLVSRSGMFGGGLNDRVGPLCRTVTDAARVLDVIAGYDPTDELTAFNRGRIPATGYESAAGARTLEGLRIGVLREYMDKRLFTEADAESIDIVDRAVADLRKLGATIVDPGPEGALFQACIDTHVPRSRHALFVRQFPDLFPRDAAGAPTTDHIPLLVDMALSPALVPKGPTVRNFGPAGDEGEGGGNAESKYVFNQYLRQRGDSNIRSVADLIAKSRFYTDIRADSRFADKKVRLEGINRALTLDLRERMANRAAIQEMVLQCMASLNVDVLTYPSGNVPPPVLGAPVEPNKNDRSYQSWALLGQQGFPAMTVPAGFTAFAFDRVRDAAAPGGTRLVGPVAAKLPVGIDFLARPFDEATLLRVASAYEAATKHRVAPPGFGATPQASR